MYDKLLVLDLDETLVHSCCQCEHPPIGRAPDYHVCDYVGYHRPHLQEFLRWARGAFRYLGIWTAGGPQYASACVDTFAQKDFFDFVWDSRRCSTQGWSMRGPIPIKPIKKLKRQGYDPKRVIALDNSSHPWVRSYGNHMSIPDYLGEPDDRWLLEVMKYLPQFCEAEDVRPFEWRGWWR